MEHILDLTNEALKNFLTEKGQKPFRANQLFEWLYRRQISSFDEIDNMKFVFELGEKYWKQMELWLRSHRIATAAESKALTYATKISSGFFPDEKQSKSLMKLRGKAIAEGFPPK